MLPALQFKCPARAVCVGGPLWPPACESCSVLQDEGKISNLLTPLAALHIHGLDISLSAG